VARRPPPEPFPAYGSRTRFLPVFEEDWLAVTRGSKTEYRLPFFLTHLMCPSLAVAWRRRPQGDPDRALVVIEEAWREPVGAISPESLAREGFPALDHFRRYWMRRSGERFKPLSEVQVVRIRPFEPDDAATTGLQLVRNLYGPYLPDGI
jgi:hypothetical protein